jgi:hypothetical protein
MCSINGCLPHAPLAHLKPAGANCFVCVAWIDVFAWLLEPTQADAGERNGVASMGPVPAQGQRLASLNGIWSLARNMSRAL